MDWAQQIARRAWSIWRDNQIRPHPMSVVEALRRVQHLSRKFATSLPWLPAWHLAVLRSSNSIVKAASTRCSSGYLTTLVSSAGLMLLRSNSTWTLLVRLTCNAIAPWSASCVPAVLSWPIAFRSPGRDGTDGQQRFFARSSHGRAVKERHGVGHDAQAKSAQN